MNRQSDEIIESVWNIRREIEKEHGDDMRKIFNYIKKKYNKKAEKNYSVSRKKLTKSVKNLQKV